MYTQSFIVWLQNWTKNEKFANIATLCTTNNNSKTADFSHKITCPCVGIEDGKYAIGTHQQLILNEFIQ